MYVCMYVCIHTSTADEDVVVVVTLWAVSLAVLEREGCTGSTVGPLQTDGTIPDSHVGECRQLQQSTSYSINDLDLPWTYLPSMISKNENRLNL